MRSASVASEALSTVPTRESSPRRYASSSRAGCSSSTARTTRPPPLSLPSTISSSCIPVVRGPVIFAPAPRTMVTAKRRECQSGAPIGYRSEAFRHYELQTVPCPCRPNLSRLGELLDKIGWCMFERRRSCTDAQPGEERAAPLDRHELGVGEALGEHAARRAEPVDQPHLGRPGAGPHLAVEQLDVWGEAVAAPGHHPGAEHLVQLILQP